MQLEDLEGRALLSTAYTLYEWTAGGVKEVIVQTDSGNTATGQIFAITGNPTPTFVLNTDTEVGDLVTVRNTGAGVPIQINSHNGDTIDVGDDGSVVGIYAPVTIYNPSSNLSNQSAIYINDAADATARTVTLSTSSPGFGQVAGLAPAPIFYNYEGTQLVWLSTGTGANTVNVQATGVGTMLNGDGLATVNVGVSGSVQGILAELNITDSLSGNTINIDDSADAAARTATLSNFWLANWGQVAGLAPAPIEYNYAGTSSIHVATGFGANTVNVQATGVPTSVSDFGLATVNVGVSGSVQGILGAFYVNDPPWYNTINIDDSADATARTATLSNYGSGWGEVTGLAPAPIFYDYNDTSSLHLTTYVSGDTIDVQATGSPTYISTNGNWISGFDTVNIGCYGTVQGILVALFVSNPPGYTAVNINDSADTGQRAATLSSFSNGPDFGPWGSIAGLAPAAINFSWNDMYEQVNVSAPNLGTNISWTVNPDAYESVVGVYVVIDGIFYINL